MKMKDILIERKHFTLPRDTGNARLNKIEAKAAWKMMYDEENEEFRDLVLKFYDEIRKTQMTIDAREAAQQIANERRRKQLPRLNRD